MCSYRSRCERIRFARFLLLGREPISGSDPNATARRTRSRVLIDKPAPSVPMTRLATAARVAFVLQCIAPQSFDAAEVREHRLGRDAGRSGDDFRRRLEVPELHEIAAGAHDPGFNGHRAEFAPVDALRPKGRLSVQRRRSYWMTISTRRFCGSRTLSPVGTSRPFSPMPMTVIACAGTPSRTSASLTALARRSDSAML